MTTETQRIREFEVRINEEGIRLDEFLAIRIGRMSRSQANACIKSGSVGIEPFRNLKPSMKVHVGDKISITQRLSGDVPMYDALVLLDETEDFWVFDKPAGMAVHPTANIYHNTVTRYIETQLKAQPYVVHRLDKDTSGVLLVAKNADVVGELGALFLSHDVEKEYEAVCINPRGKFYPGSRIDIDIPLGFAGIVLPRITMGPGSLNALTHIECTDIHDDLAWLRVKIDTGRQHQIRVHLAMNGTPIVGDKLYFCGESFYKDFLDGEPTPQFAPVRHLLHAASLGLRWQGRDYRWHAPIPEIMTSVFRSNTATTWFPTDYARLYMGD